MSSLPFIMKPFGPDAMILEWSMEVSETILREVVGFSNYLKHNHLPESTWELIPIYSSITLISKKGSIDWDNLSERLSKWYFKRPLEAESHPVVWNIPVCYDSSFGLDLEDVASQTGLDPAEIIRIHTAQIYTVYGLGFLPGFMYLGGVSEQIQVSRRPTPRLSVPAGSVGVASAQTGIYPQQSPGGWNIIGNCPIRIFSVQHNPPTEIRAGDKVRFYAIDLKEHELHRIQDEVGLFKLNKSLLDD